MTPGIRRTLLALCLSLFVSPLLFSQENTDASCTTVNYLKPGSANELELASQTSPNTSSTLSVAPAEAKWVKEYCAAHPGRDWSIADSETGRTLGGGHCPMNEQIAESHTQSPARH